MYHKCATTLWVKVENKENKAFIDIRLCPGIATPPEEDRATPTGDLAGNNS